MLASEENNASNKWSSDSDQENVKEEASLPSVDQLAYGETNSQTKGEGKAIVKGRFNSGGKV